MHTLWTYVFESQKIIIGLIYLVENIEIKVDNLSY